MYINFSDLPNSSRIWIYQADRQLGKEEVSSIELALMQFTTNWEAHQNALQASFQVLHNRFVILAVNSSYYEPSGCSIDKSTAIIKEIEQAFSIKLLDRLTVAYLVDDEVKTLKIKELKQKIESEEFSSDISIFNNTILTKGELEQNWQIPAGKSWLSKYFSQVAV